MSLRTLFRNAVNLWMVCLLLVWFAGIMIAQSPVSDPGVRGGTIDAGLPLASVASTPGLADLVANGVQQFAETQAVNGDNNGLGPRFNSDSCGSCHSQPALGGTSPNAAVFPNVGPNPQFQQFGTQANTIPDFVTADGPVREARFTFFQNPDGTLSSTRDGGVHDLFVITGRGDAQNCTLTQPDFAGNLALGNVIFRIPTPLFGAGLIENIDDATILLTQATNAAAAAALGISGHPNRNANDGTITRFGWKAQNKSLNIFAGEAYNVEMGVTNELFPTERPSPGDGILPGSCILNPLPEDTTHFATTSAPDVPSDVTQFTTFMRTLAPPTPSLTVPGGATSIANGAALFTSVGCALCHTPSMPTAPSNFTADLGNVTANLFSDLLVHHMGGKLADGVRQGNAGFDEFRSAPLWGLGQRIFLLHDGRTTDLLTAIRQHESSGSEANGVIDQFRALTGSQKQDLLNFLRSL
jgi:CxxC motif-containing protein (DUF1111 family)